MTLSPHLAEGLFAAGAGERLVATVEYSEYPEPAARLPRIGDAFRLDIERIVALETDLVIAWDSGNPAAAVRQLRSLGVAVWSVEIRDPYGIPAFIEDAGRAGGSAETAAEVAAQLRFRLDALQRDYRDAPKVRYFYQVDQRPLFTINGEHLISRGLALCGAHNVFADEPGLAFQVGREAVLLADPDVLLAPGVEGEPDPLEAWRAWPGMTAVRSDALHLLPADEVSRATPRFIASLDRACKLLHGLDARMTSE